MSTLAWSASSPLNDGLSVPLESPGVISRHGSMSLQALYAKICDASVGKSSLVARLTDQRLSTNPNATVSASLSIHTHPMVSWMSLATGNGRMTTLGFLIARWKQIEIHSGRRKTRQSDHNVRVRSPPRLLVSSHGPVVVSLRISNLTVLMAL